MLRQPSCPLKRFLSTEETNIWEDMKNKNMSILSKNFSKTVVKVESIERNAKLRKESNYYEFCDPAFFAL